VILSDIGIASYFR